jgi:hypothetical protein
MKSLIKPYTNGKGNRTSANSVFFGVQDQWTNLRPTRSVITALNLKLDLVRQVHHVAHVIDVRESIDELTRRYVPFVILVFKWDQVQHSSLAPTTSTPTT